MPGSESRAHHQSGDGADASPIPARWRSRLWPEDRLGRAFRIGAGVLLIGGGAAAIAPWTVSRGALREEIAAQLRSSSGLYVYTEGASTFSLLPRPSIRLQKISFVDPRAAMVITADQLSGEVRLLPLLAGRLELARAELLRPKLIVDLDGKPMTTAGAAVRAADARPASPEAAKADRARLGIVSFIDGSALLRRGKTTVDQIDHIDATLDWRRVASPASLDGVATWRGQRGAISAWIARPSELLRGDLSQVTFDLKCPALTLSANGAAAGAPRPRFEGRLIASTDSLREIVRILRGVVPMPIALGAASIDAKAAASRKGLDLTEAKLKLDSSRYSGNLAWRVDDPRPQLSGTLAAESIDLGEIFRYLPPIVGRDGHFSRDPFAWRNKNLFDVDLRISAGRAWYDRVQARDVAGAILLQDGRLDASLADASMYKGSVKARLVMGPSTQGGMEMKTNVQARGLDWGAFAWDRFGDSRLNGLADIHLNMEGSGESLDEIARNLKGHGDMDLTNGEIVGLDVERVLRRIEKRPLASAFDIHSGRTPFNTAHLSADFGAGAATLNDSSVAGGGYLMNLTGAAQLRERQIALHAVVAAAKAQAEPAAAGPGFAFDIQGSWDNPAIVPDAQSLIRRSGAARPLLQSPRAAGKPPQ